MTNRKNDEPLTLTQATCIAISIMVASIVVALGWWSWVHPGSSNVSGTSNAYAIEGR